MTEKDELKFLTDLVAAVLYQTPLPVPPPDLDYNRFALRLKKVHLLVFVRDALLSYPRLPDAVKGRILDACDKATMIALQQTHFGEELLRAFEAAGVRSMPLKGLVMRSFYPDPLTRTMTDVDILVDIGKGEEIAAVMQKAGLRPVGGDPHHDMYAASENITVELHKTLLTDALTDRFGVGFSRGTLVAGTSFTYRLSTEEFYIHMIGHAANHFTRGGIGVRALLDIRVYLDRFESEMDRAYLEKELRAAGLWRFALALERLSRVWFQNAPGDEMTDRLGLYIFRSGADGSREQRERLEVVRQKNEGRTHARAGAVFSAIFPPRGFMLTLYPKTAKCPLFLPVAWVRRWFAVLLGRRKNIARLGRLASMPQNEVEELHALFDELELTALLVP